jgi:hypothetical protein
MNMEAIPFVSPALGVAVAQGLHGPGGLEVVEELHR